MLVTNSIHICVCVCLYEYPGAAFCQLMDWLFPGSLDLSTVRFQCNNPVDFVHNYSLLQAAFTTAGVKKVSIFLGEDVVMMLFKALLK